MGTEQHGGKREGAGRPTLPKEERRSAVTVRLLPGASVELDDLAEKSQSSQGAVVEWFVLSPEAQEARKQCLGAAAKFTRRQPSQVESTASTIGRAVLRKKSKAQVTAAGEKEQRKKLKSRVSKAGQPNPAKSAAQ